MIAPDVMADNLERLVPDWSDAHLAALLMVLSRELFRRGVSGPGALFAAASELEHRGHFPQPAGYPIFSGACAPAPCCRFHDSGGHPAEPCGGDRVR